jgi:Predicted signal transduction protein with a C-terminal ATPase domain
MTPLTIAYNEEKTSVRSPSFHYNKIIISLREWDALPKINLFRKMMALIIVMLVPIMLLYFYSNRTSTEVLREELHHSSQNQLQFFQQQADATIASISLWPNLLLHDPDISELKDIFESPGEFLDLKHIQLVKRIQQKINIQESSLNWTSSLIIYSPVLGRAITGGNTENYDHTDLNQRLQQGWQVQTETDENGESRYTFSLFTVSPYSSFHRPENASLIIELRFDGANIVRMLDTFKSGEQHRPFYYKEGTGIIYGTDSDKAFVRDLAALLDSHVWDSSNYDVFELQGESYLVNAKRSDITGWMLVDYLPLSEMMKPIAKSNMLFYVSIAAILLMSVMVASFLYSGVQVPMRQLVTSFQKLKNEDYSVRLKPKGNSEFSFVFTRFNSMVAQIQELFGKVYLEKIHVKEARLKQLQSQINPHFIYNCFSFISSMAKLKNYEAIVAMSKSLSEYYRYTTRHEREAVALSEEVDLVVHYLDIQRMRMKRLHYEVHVPPWLKHKRIPPLTIQPLVENAVIHGIESSMEAGLIVIRADEKDGKLTVTVEDDGKGVPDAEMPELLKRLTRPMDEEMGCGLWNVHQRMLLRYGAEAGLALSPSPLGGLKAALSWTDE